MMLVHINQPDIAGLVHNAWLRTIEDGVHTYDIFAENISKQKVGTEEFAVAVVKRLGLKPEKLAAVSYGSTDSEIIHSRPCTKTRTCKETVGIDVFVDWTDGKAEKLGCILNSLSTEKLPFLMLTNRGVKVYPGGMPETFCTDHWRARYLHRERTPVSHADIIELLSRFQKAGLDFIKTEHLHTFDAEQGFSD